MIEINAAILERRPEDIEDKISEVSKLVDFVQIDICDGRFVPSKTFMSAGCPSSAKCIALLTQEMSLELDMMIDWDTPIKGRFKKWLQAIKLTKAKRLVLHFGSSSNWEDIFNSLITKHSEYLEIGLGVHLQDNIDDVLALLQYHPFSYVQIMGIEKVGYGGQVLSSLVFDKISQLRSAKPTMPISVDGGVKLENVKELIEAGATRLALGSGLFDTLDIEAQAKNLRDATA